MLYTAPCPLCRGRNFLGQESNHRIVVAARYRGGEQNRRSRSRRAGGGVGGGTGRGAAGTQAGVEAASEGVGAGAAGAVAGVGPAGDAREMGPANQEFLKAGDAGTHIPTKFPLVCAKCWLLNSKLQKFTIST